MNLPREHYKLRTPLPTLKLNTVKLEHLQAANLKVSQQQPLHFGEENKILYHTTIPIYIMILIAVGSVIGIAYRKYKSQRSKVNSNRHEEKETNPKQPPAQFTTKVFNRRCSTGGGVTPP